MLGRECPEAVLPARALYLPTFSHLLIVNKLVSLSHTLLRARSISCISALCECAAPYILIVGTNVTVTFWYKSQEILGLTVANPTTLNFI